MDLPHSTPIDINTIKPKSQFGNPVWGNDDNEATSEERRGRRQGFEESLRLLNGPAIMTNNLEFQTGLDAALDLLNRRLAEL